MSNQPSLLRRLWNSIGFIGDLQTLWGLLVVFGGASWVMSTLPGGWHPPQYWLVAGTAFSRCGWQRGYSPSESCGYVADCRGCNVRSTRTAARMFISR